MSSRWTLLTAMAFLFCLPSSAQKFQVGTNAFGLACLGTLNAEVDYAVSRHWTVGLSGYYNPFSYPREGGDLESRMQLRQRSVAASARWWPWHVYSGWWLSGKVQWQEYNMGGIISQQTEEGEKYGGGVTFGYAYMINPHLNLEMGLGVWGGFKQYTVYSCPRCGTKVAGGSKGFLMPNDLIIALSYVF